TRMARITGTVVDSDGKPMANSVLVMAQVEAGLTATAGAQVRPDGTFTIANVAPGKYTIVALNPQAILGGGGAAELVTADVTVTGDDINNLQIAGMKSAVVTGKVVLPQAAAGAVRLSSIQLMTAPIKTELSVGLGGGGLV